MWVGGGGAAVVAAEEEPDGVEATFEEIMVHSFQN